MQVALSEVSASAGALSRVDVGQLYEEPRAHPSVQCGCSVPRGRTADPWPLGRSPGLRLPPLRVRGIVSASGSCQQE
jgi:hypothetical protein